MKSNIPFNLLITLFFGASILTGCGPDDNSSQDTSDKNEPVKISSNKGTDKQNVHAHEGDDDHHHAKVPGPNGGRLIVDVEPHFEFLVLPNHHAQITFVNDDIKPISPTNLEIKLTGGDRSNPIEITFEKKDNSLISKIPLPQEHNAALVLQINGDTLSETVFERFHLNMEKCPDCDLHEYACICGHSVHEH